MHLKEQIHSMKILTTLFIIFSTFLITAQTITGNVKDNEGTPITYAKVIDIDNKLLAFSDSMGFFSFDAAKVSGFGVAYFGFETEWFIVDRIQNNHVDIVLEFPVLDLEAVVVTSERDKRALDFESVNILDYRPFGDLILTLKKYKGAYYIGIDSIGVEGKNYLFSHGKPKSLFEDCLGNMHILTSQDAFQFQLIDDRLEVLAAVPIEEFKVQLQSCVAFFDSKLITEELRYHNQLYQLVYYSGGDVEPKVVYSQIDRVTMAVAEEEYLKLTIIQGRQDYGDQYQADELLLRRDLRRIHNGENPDANLAFLPTSSDSLSGTSSVHDPSGGSDPSGSSGWMDAITNYKLFSYPVDVRSYQVGHYLAVIDFMTDSVTLLDQEGKVASEKAFDGQHKIKEVWQDESNGDLFLHSHDGGTSEIYRLDVFTGQTEYITNLNDIPLSRSRKIHQGWLYFRILQYGYYKVYRRKMVLD